MKTKSRWVLGALWVALATGGCGGGSSRPVSGAAPTGGEGRAPARAMTNSQAHYESVLEMLRGKVPGLELITTQPGQLEVRIRGMTQSLREDSQQPLVVVDGVPSSRPAGEVLLELNPPDVQSITVLKDVASTAVYGTRGANGVILVQQRKGG